MNKSLGNKDASGVYFPALNGAQHPPGHIGDHILLTLRMDSPLASAWPNSSFLGQDTKFGVEKERRENRSPALSCKPAGRRMESAAGFPPATVFQRQPLIC